MIYRIILLFSLLFFNSFELLSQEVLCNVRVIPDKEIQISDRQKLQTLQKTVREFVDNNLLARDSRVLRSYIKEIQPDVDLTIDLETEAGDVKGGVKIPIGITFFWPDSDL